MDILIIILLIIGIISIFILIKESLNKSIERQREHILINLKRADYINFAGICALGLCTRPLIDNVHVSTKACKEFNTLLIEACKELGVYSHNHTYPIKDIDGFMQPNTIFHHSAKNNSLGLDVSSMWDKNTNYGKARLMVLKKLIGKYEKLLKE